MNTIQEIQDIMSFILTQLLNYAYYLRDNAGTEESRKSGENAVVCTQRMIIEQGYEYFSNNGVWIVKIKIEK